MIRKFTFLFLTVFVMLSARAGFTPVTVTGFNKDVVANGVGPATTSTTSAVDDTIPTQGYAFLSTDYRQTSSSPAPTYALPANGLINSVNTTGLNFQLASYSGNNSLMLWRANQSGDLLFSTPQTASDVYVLATSGSATAAVTFVVNFTDGTSQTFTNTISDWYGGAGYAIRGIGRVNLTGGVPDAGGGTLDPRLYEFRLTLASANYSKPIASVSVIKTGITGPGYVQVMAISVNTVSPCGPPTNPPTNLVLTPTVYGIAGSFTASVPAANKYLVLRAPGAGGPDTPPTDGQVYTAGQTLGNATIISASANTTFNDPGLTIGSTFTYFIIGYSDSSCYGISPAYNAVNLLIGSATIPSCAATPGGTYTVGPTGTYPSLSAAMTTLNNAAGASGNIIIELQPTYTSTSETFPITVPNISSSPCAIGNPTLIIRPAAGATGLVIAGKVAAPLLDFNGARRVTLDGRPGGVGTTSQLSIVNDSTAGVAIRLINDASYNTVTYCDVQGRNASATSSALSGVIYIGTALSATSLGNDFNTISYSNIHGNANGTPAIGISAYGTTPRKAGYNDSCTITNCNIYDFFSASAATAGVKVDVGNTAWTITNNSIYQTASRTYTAANTHRGLWITPNSSAANDSTSNNFMITNNNIGGTAANAGGTAYTMLGGVANVFYGMDLSMGAGTATSVQNNKVTNIALTSTSTSTTTGVFAGINIANGNVNVGNLVGNIIGSATTAGSISVISGSQGTTHGIRVGSGVTINITGNTISGITGSGTTGGATSTNFNGIYIAGGSTVNVTNNTIGSTTLAGSINLTASTSATAQTINGIYVFSGTTTNLTNNTIANITNAQTGASTSATVRGIYVTTSTATVTGNTIRNLSSATPATGSGASSSLIGIALSSTSGACNIISNNIYALSTTSTSVSAGINITGLFFSGTSSATSYIIKNSIHSFDAAAADTNIVFTGIDFASATAVVANNFIRLGIKPDGTSFTTATINRGISSNSSSSFNGFFYNSIYIGGTGVGTSTIPKNSYAFIRTASSGTYDIRNNILANSRSNASTGGKHYALYFTGAATGAAPNFNVYYANGTGGVFAYNGTADIANYTVGWVAGDANSSYGNPNFANATGSSTAVDLHIPNGTASPAESAGTSIGFVSDDYDSQVRNTTLPDAGADEFSGTNVNLCSGLPVAGFVRSSAAAACVGVNFTLTDSASTGGPAIGYQWQSSTDSTNWTNISGANSSSYTTSQNGPTYYRIVVTCLNTNTSANSAGVLVSAPVTPYVLYNGTLYTESFENWISSCSTTELPGTSWKVNPITGNNSWRRNDQGANANWTSNTGAYTPASTLGSYSARFHSYNAPNNTQGTIDFYVNMSAATGLTSFKFDYINTDGSDSLSVFISTNGGTTFTRLDSVGLRSAWSTKTIMLNTNSATTVIRFTANSDFGNTDIGIDKMQLSNFSACAGTPIAGAVISSANPICSGVNFILSDTAVSQLSGVTYQWQSSIDSTTWIPITNATATSYTTSITTTTYYRLVVTCANGGAVAYTAGLKITLNTPFNCYCTPTYSLGGINDYVTSVKLLTLSQATAANNSPYYINYITTQNAIPNLRRGATDTVFLSFGPDGSQYSGVWIDFNQDGVFATSEYFSRARNAGSGGSDSIFVVVPSTAALGQTRMRIRGGEDVVLTSAQACGASSSSYGQAQDYLVNITNGTVPITLLSFSGEHKQDRNQLTWTTASEQNNRGFELQRSADGVNFSAITFVASKAANGNSTSNITYSFADAKTFAGNNYYRLKQIDNDGKISYSSTLLLKGDKVNALTLSMVYPNPAKDKLNVIIASPKADKLTLILSDIAGKVVRQQKVNAIVGDNNFEVNVQSLTAGNYVIKAICNDGCETVISRFVKQ